MVARRIELNFCVLVAATLSLLSSDVTALTFETPQKFLFNNKLNSTTEIRINPFENRFSPISNFSSFNNSFNKSFELYPANGKAQTIELIKSLGQDFPYRLEAIEQVRSLLLQPVKTTDYQVFAGKFPICRIVVRSHEADGRVIMLGGTLPTQFHSDLDHRDPISNESVVRLLKNTLRLNSLQVVSNKPCIGLFNSQNEILAQVIVRADGGAIEFLVSEREIVSATKLMFDAADGSGTGKAYKKNPRDGEIITVNFVDLENDGSLANEYFVSEPIGVEPAYDENNEFSYDIDDERFAEVNAFTHANLHMQYFLELGYNFTGPRIHIKVHDKPGSPPSTNQAVYEPAVSSKDGIPYIRIGDGDGNTLENLSLDSDVVSHELGHHIVFEYLKSIEHASYTLHEALADYFAFARADDYCLGESVCPAGAEASPNGVCWVANQCLRTADNSLVLGTSVIRSEGHEKGQIVTGLFADLYRIYNIPKEHITRIVFGAVQLLNPDSGYKDLFIALLGADQIVYGGDYGCDILQAAISRGFRAYVADLECGSSSIFGGVRDQVSGQLSSAGYLGSAPAKQGTEEKPVLLCGTITQNFDSVLGPLVLVLLLVAPLVLVSTNFKRRLRSLPNWSIFILLTFTSTNALALESWFFKKSELFYSPSVDFTISQYWEGETINQDSLRLLRKFRQSNPDIKIAHFISPAYFLKPTSNQSIADLKDSILPNDRVCLNAQSWKSIVLKTSAPFRYGPTFWGNTLSESKCQKNDCGREVPLSFYDFNEVKSILEVSALTLQKNGLGKVNCMVTTGWMSSKNLLTAAASVGIQYDYSEVPVQQLETRLKAFPLYDWLRIQWPARESLPQPVKVKIGPYQIIQAGNNLGTLDYLTKDQIISLVKSYLTKRRGNSEKSYLNLGFYHETASIELGRLDGIIKEIRELALKYNTRIAFVPSSETFDVYESIAWDIDPATEKAALAH